MNTMSRQEAEALIQKYNQGTASEAERVKLEQWYHREIRDRRLEEADGDFLLLKDVLWDSVVARAGLAVESELPHKRRYLPGVSRIAAVAAIVLLATVATWMGLERDTDKAVEVQTAIMEDAIPPGGNRATLTLADGRRIDLSESQKGIVIGSDGISYADGSGLLDAATIHKESGPAPVEYATLSTPRGGTYQVTLPDGSKVWLNAASTLKYPVRFTVGEDRIVELGGEAYFEVASMPKSENAAIGKSEKLPFLVKTSHQTVEVLGTQFNISAYADETDAKTTLVEGRVRVSVNDQNNTKVLAPGEQAVVRESAIFVRPVNTEPFVAWKSGTFIFDDTPLDEAMRQVMRWYDVEVDVTQLPAKQITGIVSRQEKLSALLRALAISSDLHFTLEGRRLVLKKE